MAKRTCERCGHTMRMMQFKNETTRRLTCPDCGWRKGDAAKTFTYAEAIGEEVAMDNAPQEQDNMAEAQNKMTEQQREQAIDELRQLVRTWAKRGFGFNAILHDLLQFGGQGDDGMDEEVIALMNIPKGWEHVDTSTEDPERFDGMS